MRHEYFPKHHTAGLILRIFVTLRWSRNHLLSLCFHLLEPHETINRTLSAPDSDSEEHNSSRGGWPPPLSGTRSHGNLARKRRSASSPTSLLSSQKSQKKKHKHLSLLLEEAGLSSSDDSFDQGYWPNLTALHPTPLSLSSQTLPCLWASPQLVSLFAFGLRPLPSNCALSLTISTSLAAGFSAKLPFF